MTDVLQDQVKDLIENAVENSKVGWVRSLLTNNDNETFCVVRVGGLLAILVGLGLTIWVVIHTGTFNLVEFGAGIGTLLGSVAGGVRLKHVADSTDQ